MDFPDSLIGRFHPSLVHKTTSCVHTELLLVSSGRQALARPSVGIHWKTSLMSSSLLFQQCPASLVRLIWIFLVIGNKWQYSCYFVGCCFQDLFNMAPNLFAQLPTSFFSIRFVSIDVVHPCSSVDTTAAWKKSRFILSDNSDFHTIDSLSIAVNALSRCILISLSGDETLLLRYVNLFSNSREQPFRVEMSLIKTHSGTGFILFLLNLY